MYFYRQTRAYAHISMLHTKYISCDAWERVTMELNSWIEIKKKCKYLYIYEFSCFHVDIQKLISRSNILCS